MATPQPEPNGIMHTLDRCRDISSRELEIIFCAITKRLIECPEVSSPHTLVMELANTIHTRLERFCLTNIEELIYDRYQCMKYHCDQEDLINHIYDVICSLERHNIL